MIYIMFSHPLRLFTQDLNNKTMKNEKIKLEWAYNILSENNNALEVPFESVGEYAKFSAENDPTFFTWLFGSESDVNDYGSNMSLPQKEAYNEFISNIS